MTLKPNCMARVVVAAASLFLAQLASGASSSLRFTETQMPIGTTASAVPLAGGEYTSFGITTFNVYRYHDSRDPFSDGSENFGGTEPYGLSLDTRGNLARVDFLTPALSIDVDWWTITGTFVLDVYDTSNNHVYGFSGSGAGTQTIVAPNISYFTWHDSGGFVQVSNLRFTNVPEPSSLAVLALGLTLVAVRRRKKL